MARSLALGSLSETLAEGMKTRGHNLELSDGDFLIFLNSVGSGGATEAALRGYSGADHPGDDPYVEVVKANAAPGSTDYARIAGYSFEAFTPTGENKIAFGCGLFGPGGMFLASDVEFAWTDNVDTFVGARNARIRRTADKTLALDDGAGGAADLVVMGDLNVRGTVAGTSTKLTNDVSFGFGFMLGDGSDFNYAAFAGVGAFTGLPSGAGKQKFYAGESPTPGVWEVALASDTALVWNNDDNLFPASTPDLRLRRSGAVELRLDDGANGVANLRITGSVTADNNVQAAAHVLPSGAFWTENAGTPEGSITAGKGSLCSDTTNGQLYIKTTATSSTGWALVTHA